MHGRMRLTEVRCTRIRLAPFCIRLSKKPCGRYLVRRVGRQSWNARVMESSANGNACLLCATYVFLEEKGIENRNNRCLKNARLGKNFSSARTVADDGPTLFKEITFPREEDYFDWIKAKVVRKIRAHFAWNNSTAWEENGWDTIR